MTIPSYQDAQLEQARRLGTSTLHEASGLADSSVDPAIRTIWAGASLAGAAYPVACAPGDNLAIHVAMEQAPRGSVLVVSAGGFVAGYWGEVLAAAAEAAGVAGLVIDGGVRDIAALRARRFPAFARGISVRGTLKASVPSVGRPISLAGTPVAAGDLVVADDDGVVVIPAERAQAVLAEGQARADKEARMMAALARGETTLDLLGLSQWRAAR
ncbi:4-carboxy-4-hydroxy-2-oxoadipate aldolase/oxaloacetate decarboxylase [Burkholderia sp. Cy-637]|uniref:4-carboxy-4-hydroxy-2-oxoadipate aldolase/oxaloacetate decarboxylase n=1 Tax=Burkholderia sp. Cy-637 TaxID=2608327 RepID=UPI001421148D|nr:4-carboxy-4-hydroxy-2-oxoadipate aldolase/oxaloacetate decarboxylase [Burkholderia sp. Cy-637]NIF90498.1 4-carboxy-4-hydroxy-2-oxoadipate aldolase/oxaloacetate decarboxylase [Burkholderia sp. Cy-637]